MKTDKEQPVIGAVDGIEGLFVATGFSGHGVKLALSVAEGLVQMLRGSPVSAFDVDYFSPSRLRGATEEWSGVFGV